MATERPKGVARGRKPVAATPDPERQRIPLPPLPAPRRETRSAPASPPGLSHEESDQLIAAPEQEERTGARGVTILNELVDEIQKGLDTETSRHAGTSAASPYRKTIACSLSLAAESASEPSDSNHRRHE